MTLGFLVYVYQNESKTENKDEEHDVHPLRFLSNLLNLICNCLLLLRPYTRCGGAPLRLLVIGGIKGSVSSSSSNQKAKSRRRLRPSNALLISSSTSRVRSNALGTNLRPRPRTARTTGAKHRLEKLWTGRLGHSSLRCASRSPSNLVVSCSTSPLFTVRLALLRLPCLPFFLGFLLFSTKLI